MPCRALSPLAQYSSYDEANPIGALRNLYRPKGVMNVVSSWLSGSSATCQYPFAASSVEKYLELVLTINTASLGVLVG